MQKHAATLADYTPAAKILHWISAIVFLVQFPIGFIMVQMSQGTTASFLLSLHKSTGFFILWLAVLRLANRMRTGVPRRASQLAGWHFRATKLAHSVLYVLMILVPLTGWMGASAFGSLELFGVVSLPAIMTVNEGRAIWILWTHSLLAFGIMALVAIHIGFALQGYLDGAEDLAASADPAGASTETR